MNASSSPNFHTAWGNKTKLFGSASLKSTYNSFYGAWGGGTPSLVSAEPYVHVYTISEKFPFHVNTIKMGSYNDNYNNLPTVKQVAVRLQLKALVDHWEAKWNSSHTRKNRKALMLKKVNRAKKKLERYELENAEYFI